MYKQAYCILNSGVIRRQG